MSFENFGKAYDNPMLYFNDLRTPSELKFNDHKKWNELETIYDRIKVSNPGVEINNGNPLTDSDKKKWIDDGMAPGIVNDVSKDKDGVYHLRTVNEKLENKKHPDTHVVYIRKLIDLGNKKLEGVFPVFKSLKDVQLPADKLKASDDTQFKYCNEKLKEAVKNDPKLRAKFSPTQLKMIDDNKTPRGYVWHHNEEKGKMQLVDAKTHAKTGHTGGRAIWGGGKDSR